MYEGMFKDDKKDGEGVYSNPITGKVYRQNWEDGHLVSEDLIRTDYHPE